MNLERSVLSKELDLWSNMFDGAEEVALVAMWRALRRARHQFSLGAKDLDVRVVGGSTVWSVWRRQESGDYRKVELCVRCFLGEASAFNDEGVGICSSCVEEERIFGRR